MASKQWSNKYYFNVKSLLDLSVHFPSKFFMIQLHLNQTYRLRDILSYWTTLLSPFYMLSKTHEKKWNKKRWKKIWNKIKSGNTFNIQTWGPTAVLLSPWIKKISASSSNSSLVTNFWCIFFGSSNSFVILFFISPVGESFFFSLDDHKCCYPWA